MRIVRIGLEAAAPALPRLARFYDDLGFDVTAARASVTVRAGATELSFRPCDDGDPFYHFALRVPRDRFGAARAWLGERAGLLADPDTAKTTFRFATWNAEACYTEDPAGNVVELITHHELPDESGAAGAFDARELLGACEIGIVGDDVPAMGRALSDAGVELWDGTLDDPDGIAFMGARDGVLILARSGRAWMPTTRPGVRAHVDVAARGSVPADVVVPGAAARVRVVTTTG